MLFERLILPDSERKNDTWATRAHFVPHQFLEFRSIRPRNVLFLSKQFRPSRQRIVSPLAVEIQPVDWVPRVIGLECFLRSIIAINIGTQDRVPQCTRISMVHNQPIREVEAGNSVIMFPESSLSLALSMARKRLEVHTQKWHN